VGFNSRFYDLPLLTMAMLGYRAPALKEISNAIIYEELKQRDFEQKYNVKIGKYNHVDLIEVAPLMASLKIYGGRLHCQRMQELPIHHAKDLTEREAKAVKLYCINDLDTTIDLLNLISSHNCSFAIL
jgi:DNA polymerase elongation subunit (family B)